MSVSLECWGQDWEWVNCANIALPQVPFKRLTLAPYTSHALRLNLAPIDDSLASLVSQEQTDNITMATDFFTEGEHPDTRVLLTRLSEKETLIVNDVNPNQVYRITLAPHKHINASTVFFKINANETIPWSTLSKSRSNGDDILLARAQEISIVVLILALWMLAIGLFVHRWGKIRMLEPYQPDYKAIHDSNCPLNTSSSPQLVPAQVITAPTAIRPPTFKALPRKSNSLCFTPSMLRTSMLRQDSLTQKWGHSKQHPHHRLRGRFSSESSAHSSLHESDTYRKVRSAENLRHPRINLGRSIDGGNQEDKQSSSLENCFVRQGVGGGGGGGGTSNSGVVLRGASLDSSQVRKSLGRMPWWTQAMGVSSPYPHGRSTPEIRISPTPSETTSCPHSRGCPVLQRQDPLDETLLPPMVVPYATLHEEENEGDDGGSVSIDMSQEMASYSSQESQSQEEPQHRPFHRNPRDHKLTHMSQVTQSTSQESQNSDSITGSRDSSV